MIADRVGTTADRSGTLAEHIGMIADHAATLAAPIAMTAEPIAMLAKLNHSFNLRRPRRNACRAPGSRCRARKNACIALRSRCGRSIRPKTRAATLAPPLAMFQLP
jgi:hypothetical protein